MLYKGKGCFNLQPTPATRAASRVYEVMTLYEELKELILNGASTAELKQEAIRLGMETLRMSGLKKIREGRHHGGRSRCRVTAADCF